MLLMCNALWLFYGAIRFNTELLLKRNYYPLQVMLQRIERFSGCLTVCPAVCLYLCQTQGKKIFEMHIDIYSIYALFGYTFLVMLM